MSSHEVTIAKLLTNKEEKASPQVPFPLTISDSKQKTVADVFLPLLPKPLLCNNLTVYTRWQIVVDIFYCHWV